MIRTCCAACGKLLPHTAPRCGNCSTPYCDRDCQKLNWKTGGHKDICKEIKKAGGVQQYCADTRCAEAIALAVEECADDTKGQTCFICTEALHRKTKEGLVRGCSCRGTAGFAHVSCLAEQAKVLVAEAEERNLDGKEWDERFWRWETCSLCEQDYHGVVCCALGWACWKTYVGRPETDWARRYAINVLGKGLYMGKHYEDALPVMEAQLSTMRRRRAPEKDILVAQGNLANTYDKLARFDEALCTRQDVYFGFVKHLGYQHCNTLSTAASYTKSLLLLKRFEEAKTLMRKTMPVARRVLGEGHRVTLKMRSSYGWALYRDAGATLDDLREAVTTLGKTEETARRVLGGPHPLVAQIEGKLRDARAALRAREEPGAP